MKWWYFINYKIYEFYEQSRDSTPTVASAGASSVLIQLNIITLYYPIYKITGIKLIYNEAVVIIIYVVLLLFNYLVLYSDKKYEKIFKEMEDWEFSEQRPSIFFFFYFSITIFTFLSTMIVALSSS